MRTCELQKRHGKLETHPFRKRKTGKTGTLWRRLAEKSEASNIIPAVWESPKTPDFVGMKGECNVETMRRRRSVGVMSNGLSKSGIQMRIRRGEATLGGVCLKEAVMLKTSKTWVCFRILAALVSLGLIMDAQASQSYLDPEMPAAPVVQDSVLKPFNPYPARIIGWSLVTVGLGMAAYGLAPRDDGESCELIMGFSCDKARRRSQLWFFFGGAAVGSAGALTVWVAEREVERRAALQANVAGAGAQTAVGQAKNPWIGMGLGLAGAAVGTGLIWNDPGVAATLVAVLAPSLGQLYAGTIPATVISLGVRGTAGYLIGKGALDDKFGDGETTAGLAKTIFMTGVAISLFDVWGTLQASGQNARSADQPLWGGHFASVTLAPALVALDTKRLAPGAALTMRW
jgi:hypothetical protein